MPQRGSIEGTVGIPLMHAAPTAAVAAVPPGPFVSMGGSGGPQQSMPLPLSQQASPSWRLFQHPQPLLPQHHSLMGSAASLATGEEAAAAAAVAGGGGGCVQPGQGRGQGQGQHELQGRGYPFYHELYQQLLSGGQQQQQQHQPAQHAQGEGQGGDEEGGEMMEEEQEEEDDGGAAGRFMAEHEWNSPSDPWGPGGGAQGGGF